MSLRRWPALFLWMLGVVCVYYGWSNAVEGLWTQLQLGLGGLAFGFVGLLLSLRSGVAMGWLFLGAQALMGLSLAFSDLAFGLLILLAAVLLLFPSGRLPSRRWVWAVVVLAVAASFWVVFDVLALVEDDDVSWAVSFVLSTVVLVASAVRIFNDYRHALGQTRQQLKWLAWVLAVGGFLLALSAFGVAFLRDSHQLAGVVLFVGAPVAIGFAVARYRLYDIDRIISRTVTYALVVGVLVAAVTAIAALVGTRFESPLVVAATTLGVAAVFNPLRTRVQRLVDRRFNRSTYDHEQVVHGFTSTLQDEVDMTGLLDGWVEVVSETMQPREVGVWTRIS
ncbi:MAG: hypothetical protein WAL25_14735 [Acidimicrobiia bacterium]